MKAGAADVAKLIEAWVANDWALNEIGMMSLDRAKSECAKYKPNDKYKKAIFRLLGVAEKGPVIETPEMEEFVWCKLKIIQTATSKDLFATHPFKKNTDALAALQRQICKHGPAHFAQGGKHYTYVYVLLLSNQARPPVRPPERLARLVCLLSRRPSAPPPFFFASAVVHLRVCPSVGAV